MKSYDVVDEALTFFKQYMAENNIDLVTFFQDMDEDGSMAVSYDEFREGLKVCHLTYGCYWAYIKVYDKNSCFGQL